MNKHRMEIASSKLISAFFKRELFHGDGCSCAVGTLCNNGSEWNRRLIHGEYVETPEGYIGTDVGEIEAAFEGRDKSIFHLLDVYEQYRFRGTEAFLDEINDPGSFLGLCNVFELFATKLDKSYFDTHPIKITEQRIELLEEMV